MRVILLTRDNRHYVLTAPAYESPLGEIRGRLATGGDVLVPASNYAAQEIYSDAQIESFRVRLRQVEEECAAARTAGPGLVEHYERADRVAREES